MIDHTGVQVRDVGRSKAFYAQALAVLGYQVRQDAPPDAGDGPPIAGFGAAPEPDFWVIQGDPNRPPVHVAFRADSRAVVDAFHRAALAAGGTDNGPPGVRAQYHPHYYAAYVRDPDGHNIEAVCHQPA